MSSDLCVPIGKPLETATFIRGVRDALHELLNWDEPLPLRAQAIEAGLISDNLFPLMEEETPGLVFFLEGNFQWETSVTVLAGNLGDLHSDDDYAEILTSFASMTGGGDLTRYRYVMVASCAIALARQAQFAIQDPALRWTRQWETKPEELMETLRCRKSRSDVYEAFEEVIANIKVATTASEE